MEIFIKQSTLYFKSKKADCIQVSCGVPSRNSHFSGKLDPLSAKLNLQHKVAIVEIKLSRHADSAQSQAASLRLFCHQGGRRKMSKHRAGGSSSRPASPGNMDVLDALSMWRRKPKAGLPAPTFSRCYIDRKAQITP